MKQNITLSLESDILSAAKLLAAKRNLSISRLLAEDLAARVCEAQQYEQMKQQALALLDARFDMGGAKVTSRDDLHDRQNLR